MKPSFDTRKVSGRYSEVFRASVRVRTSLKRIRVALVRSSGKGNFPLWLLKIAFLVTNYCIRGGPSLFLCPFPLFCVVCWIANQLRITWCHVSFEGVYDRFEICTIVLLYLYHSMCFNLCHCAHLCTCITMYLLPTYICTKYWLV